MLALALLLLLNLPRTDLGTVQSDIPKGQIVEKVICTGDASQNYALYLPSNYDPARKWPILYAFDPGARGRVPVERFREAAEKFGWIVVGSNNSRNAAIQSSIDAWNAITRDTAERFSIDDRRLYAAGHSGGARVSIMLATQCHDCLAGVIASGAGFPEGIEPATTMRFAVFLSAGIEDFNFPEVKSLDDTLTRIKITHQIETFAGRHEWLTPAVAADAVAWMELTAMKSGSRERDASLIDSLWNARIKQARELDEAKKTYEAFQVYLQLSSDFKGLRDVSEVQSKVDQLRSTREVRDAIRDEQQEIRKQRETESRLAALITATGRARIQDTNPGSAANNREDDGVDADSRLHSLLVELGRQAKAEPDSATRRVAKRVLEGQYVGLFETGRGLLQAQKRYDEAMRLFMLATQISPERPGAFYYLAWAYIVKGDKKNSLKALQTAVDKGFSDAAGLAGNKAFDSIRDNPQYQKIVVAMKPQR